MRPTLSLQGIKGIFPLIKKECPHAIHQHLRFSDLSGYRIAIDATLLVSRFHFSDDGHPARHLIGFHRLISTLRSFDIFPIFVFDHLTSRISAKSRETQRRREERRKARVRMRVELRRAWRLRRLESWTRRLAEMDYEDKRTVTRLLASNPRQETVTASGTDIGSSAADSVGPISSFTDWSAFQSHLASLSEQEVSSTIQKVPTGADLDRLAGIISDSQDPLHTAIVEKTATGVAERDLWSTMYEAETSPSHALAAQLRFLQSDFETARRATSSEMPTPTQSQLDEVELQLYTTFMSGATDGNTLEGANNLVRNAIQTDAPAPIQSEVIPAPTVSPEALVEQQRQGFESSPPEQRASETITEPMPAVEPPSAQPLSPAASLEAITTRSQSLQKTYARTSTPLPSTAFDDCAQLCSLLKVPVLWTGSGSPHGGAKGEAEALAASLVAAGQADIVATEDSDVLLAEVPLLRHLTGAKRSMELIDSRAARRCLFPPKVHSAKGPKQQAGSSKAGPESTSSDQGRAVETGTRECDGGAERNAAEQALEMQAATDRADKLSRYSMIELALLCGTDYNRTIPGLASRGALRLLRQHGTIRGFLRSVGAIGPVAGATQVSDGEQNATPSAMAAAKYQPPDGLSWKEYGSELSRARSIFKNPPDGLRALSLAGVRPWTLQTTAAEAQGMASERSCDEGSAAVIAIPPPPVTPLLARLGRHDTRVEDQESGRPHDDISPPSPPSFPVPEYDRAAVSALLRSRGLGKDSSDMGQLGSHGALGEHLDLQGRSTLEGPSTAGASDAAASHAGSVDGGGSPSASMPFGRMFGGETATRRFAWDA
ncbi:unnamed protein product [Parajaminaea phylloscopi]